MKSIDSGLDSLNNMKYVSKTVPVSLEQTNEVFK